MKLTRRNLTGKEYLDAATNLLHRIRLEGALEGLYEAADVQWWWRESDAPIPDRQQFWFDERGNSVACLLRHDKGTSWNNDFMVLPSARAAVEEYVIPEVIAAISNVDKPSTLVVREDDLYLQKALEDAGFARSGDDMVQAELANAPATPPLAPGFQMTTRVDDTRPHHMIRRNGSEVALKLSECSLYRPELDLCIRDASGTVAAYILFWMDDVTKVGLVEPVRTEAEYYRLGLASYLLAEGITRLHALGAESIRVNYMVDSEAAANLYHKAGFVDRFRMFEYRRE